ncbi:MAG: nucleoside-triphosphatase [Bacteroidales bacterium]|jgi:nucleoside-triphosphatase
MTKGAKIILLHGERNEGKTTKLLSLYQELTLFQPNTTGFIAPGIWDQNRKTGYNLLDLSTGTLHPLATRIQVQNSFACGNFYFFQQTIDYGNRLVEKSIRQKSPIFVVDEIGRFELEGMIWHHSFQLLCNTENLTLIAGVRTPFLDAVKEKFGLNRTIDFSTLANNETIIHELLTPLE